MMTRIQSLLGHIMEECAEVSQIASKAQRFGVDEIWSDSVKNPMGLGNRHRLHLEINDLYAVLDLLRQELNDPLFGTHDDVLVAKKIQKVEKYMKYSQDLKQVGGPVEGEGWQ